MVRAIHFAGGILVVSLAWSQPPVRSSSALALLPGQRSVQAYVGDPLLTLPMEHAAQAPVIVPVRRGERSTMGRVGMGALVGLGVGGVLGLLVASGSGESIGDPGPAYVIGVFAGGGAVIGGLVGLVSGLSSGGGGMPYPGY